MLVIRRATAYTISRGVMANASILIEGGKIVAVGADIPVPHGAEVIEARGYVVTPGLIEAHSHLGVSELGLGFEGNDVNETSDPATPHVRAIDGIYPEDEGFRDAVAAGVTAAWVTPGSANVIGGMATTVHTHGHTVDEMIMVGYSALKAALGENPKRVYSGKGKILTRMGNAAIFREWFYKAKVYLRKQETARVKGEEAEVDLRLEALAAALRGEVPVRIHAHRQDDIMTAIRLVNEFGLKFTIEHCTEGHKIVDQLRAQPNLIGVTVGPTMSARSKVELREKTWATAGILAAAGIKVALVTDHPVIPVQYLALAGAYAVKAGMTEADAMRAITLNAAEICGIGDRVGSLEVGKEADIAIFTGHPFSAQTETVATLVGGKVVYRNPKF